MPAAAIVNNKLTSARAYIANYSAEVAQFLARITFPSVPRADLYAQMIDALVVGGVWSKLDVLYVFAADIAATALTNLKSLSYTATLDTNAPTFTVDRGYTGTSSGYLHTGFNASTAGGNYIQDSAHMSLWALSTAAIDVPAIGTDTGRQYMYIRFSDNNAYGRINLPAAVNGVSGAVVTAAGHTLGNRSGAAALELYKNGVQIGTGTDVSAALTNAEFKVLRGLSSVWNGGQAAAATFGASLSGAETVILYNALHIYLQSVAGVA